MPNELLAFGDFQLRVDPPALYRHGSPVRLQAQPLRLLALLASRPGQLVTHREIQRHLWHDHIVDFAGGTHVCMRQIRAALGDGAGEPRYVETVARHGYRFVAPLRQLPAETALRTASPPPRARPSRALAATAILLACASVAVMLLLPGDSGGGAGSARARDAYLRGRYLLEQGAPDQVGRSLRFLRAALAADGDYLPAHLALAEAHRILGEFGSARLHAEHALALAPGSADAHLGLATVLMESDWDWERAGQHLDQAIRLDPASAKARQVAAARFAIVGNMPLALAQMEVAQRLDPVSTLIRADHGWLYYYAGRHADAVARCREALELDARLIGALLCVERAATAMGDHAAAADAALRIMELWRAAPADLAAVARLPDAQATQAFHQWRLRFYATYPDQSQISADDMADANAAVGRFESALSHLERAAELRSRALPFLLADPVLAPLRGHSRFAALKSRLRLDAAPVAGRLL